MKYFHLFNLFTVSLLVAACQAYISSPNAIVTAQTPLTQSTGEMVTVLQTGDFIATGEPTSGMAQIVREKGRAYLELSEDFETKAGPRLVVILTPFFEPPNARLIPETYVELGGLQKTKGAQRYEIPANVNPDKFHSAVIWCKPFNVTFGYAKLNPARRTTSLR